MARQTRPPLPGDSYYRPQLWASPGPGPAVDSMQTLYNHNYDGTSPRGPHPGAGPLRHQYPGMPPFGPPIIPPPGPRPPRMPPPGPTRMPPPGPPPHGFFHPPPPPPNFPYDQHIPAPPNFPYESHIPTQTDTSDPSRNPTMPVIAPPMGAPPPVIPPNMMPNATGDFRFTPDVHLPSMSNSGIEKEQKRESVQTDNSKDLDTTATTAGHSVEAGTSAKTGMSDLESRDDPSDIQNDQQWINDWLMKRGHQAPRPRLSDNVSPRRPCMLLPEAKQLLKRALLLSSKLRCTDAGTEQCDLQELKEELSGIRSHLSQTALTDLKQKVAQIRKKRARQKRQRQMVWQEQQDVENRRLQLQQQIDDRLKAARQAEHQAKREKDLKHSADETMSVVRMKLIEAKRSLDLLKALQKLRSIRKDSALRKGISTPVSADQMFESRLTQLSALVEEQQKTYQAENKTLQVMLEFEQEETKEKDRELLQRKVARLEQKLFQQTQRHLFGPAAPVEVNDPMFNFRTYYEAAKHNLESFIAIRNDWDTYTVPAGRGSRPPGHWVIPSKPSSQSWKSALKCEQEF